MLHKAERGVCADRLLTEAGSGADRLTVRYGTRVA